MIGVLKKLISLLIILSFSIESTGLCYPCLAGRQAISDTLRPVAAALSGGAVDGFDFERSPIWQKIPQELREDLIKISVFKNLDFSFPHLLVKIVGLIEYSGPSADLVHRAVYNTVKGMSFGMAAGERGRSRILGLSGELSGLYEIIIKRGSVLNRIALGKLESLNERVFSSTGVIKEFDAVSDNSIFEFKFHLTLRKLYQQVIAGIDSASIPHLKVLTDYSQFSNIRNLIYFGESDFGYIAVAIKEFIRSRPDIASRVSLNEKGLAIKLTLPEVKEFLLSNSTLSLVKLEQRNLKEKYINDNFLPQLRLAKGLINRKIHHLGAEKFDVIIACSRIAPKQLEEIRRIKDDLSLSFDSGDMIPDSTKKAEDTSFKTIKTSSAGDNHANKSIFNIYAPVAIDEKGNYIYDSIPYDTEEYKWDSQLPRIKSASCLGIINTKKNIKNIASAA